MKFDTVIIGGGLAGLACGLTLARQGKRCAIVSTGQGAIYFSSGSFDLLNALPDGTPVSQPLTALSALAMQAPQHPYVKLGSAQVAKMAKRAEHLFADCGISLKGDSQNNHLRIAPLGVSRSTWLSCREIPTYSLDESIPWQRMTIVGIEGFLDFHPELAASELTSQGFAVDTVWLHLPMLDRLRANPSEFRAPNIARTLDKAENINLLVTELSAIARNTDALILPACIGLDDPKILEDIVTRVGKPVMLVPTLPPSLLGMRMHQQLHRSFQQAGGQYLPGDTVLKATVSEGRVTELYTRNHVDIPLRPDNVVLASGSFFSSGLISEFNRIYEPVFGLDLISEADRTKWTDAKLFQPQPYMQFGADTDSSLRGKINGQVVENLYVSGAVLGGFDPLKQGCGAGVSLVSALHVAETILEQEGTVK